MSTERRLPRAQNFERVFATDLMSSGSLKLSLREIRGRGGGRGRRKRRRRSVDEGGFLVVLALVRGRDGERLGLMESSSCLSAMTSMGLKILLAARRKAEGQDAVDESRVFPEAVRGGEDERMSSGSSKKRAGNLPEQTPSS